MVEGVCILKHEAIPRFSTLLYANRNLYYVYNTSSCPGDVFQTLEFTLDNIGTLEFEMST